MFPPKKKTRERKTYSTYCISKLDLQLPLYTCGSIKSLWMRPAANRLMGNVKVGLGNENIVMSG